MMHAIRIYNGRMKVVSELRDIIGMMGDSGG